MALSVEGGGEPSQECLERDWKREREKVANKK
jgi:hypothetical protein